jgi:hypothetical protein
MRRQQILTSGIAIRQDFREATRFVMFQTGIADYATHGGTAFVVNYRGKPYALTCLHVPQDFEWSQLVITDVRFGTHFAPLKSIQHASDAQEAAVDADILDVAVIEFREPITSDFFKGSAYIIDQNTVGTSAVGNRLYVAGFLKDLSSIDEKINAVSCLLEFQDDGSADHDATLRRAIAELDKPEFERVTGLSGAPVFDATTNKLCGMVTRAGRDRNRWKLHYVDIMHLLDATHTQKATTSYRKTLLRKPPPDDSSSQPLR